MATEDDPPPGSTVALTRREPGKLELRLARTLEEAGPGTLVYLDGDGQVRSPAHARAMSAITYGAAGAIVAAATAFYLAAFGPLGGLAGVALGAALWLRVSRNRRMVRAVTLIQADQLDDAEVLCRRTLSGRLVPRQLRAVAHQNLSAIATRRGDFETALVELRKAIRLRHSVLRRSVMLDVLAYLEIALLVNLGRTGEARARLDGRGTPPQGNYLKVQHWTADLYVQFAEGRCTIDEDQLWERSHAALQITGAAQLLALCSWAYGERRDAEMAAHLLDQAVDRAEPGMAQRAPALWRWVETKKAAKKET